MIKEPKKDDYELVSVRIYKKTWKKIHRILLENKEKGKKPTTFPEIIEDKFKE